MNITVVEISALIGDTASKWFDLRLDDHQSLVIADGTNFVKEQAKKGYARSSVEPLRFSILLKCYYYNCFNFRRIGSPEMNIISGTKYDVITLDACYSKFLHNRICPVEAFLEKSVIRALSRLLQRRGINHNQIK